MERLESALFAAASDPAARPAERVNDFETPE
jgi:hypothetical protein